MFKYLRVRDKYHNTIWSSNFSKTYIFSSSPRGSDELSPERVHNCYTTALVVEAFFLTFPPPPTHSSCRAVAIETHSFIPPYEPISILGSWWERFNPRRSSPTHTHVNRLSFNEVRVHRYCSKNRSNGKVQRLWDGRRNITFWMQWNSSHHLLLTDYQYLFVI